MAVIRYIGVGDMAPSKVRRIADSERSKLRSEYPGHKTLIVFSHKTDKTTTGVVDDAFLNGVIDYHKAEFGLK